MELFFRKFGVAPRSIVIFHGLFGSSDNWLTQARLLEDMYSVYLVDQRNHGLSPKSEVHTYDLLADDMYRFLEQHALMGSVVIGHSMGGKAVMKFVQKFPDAIAAAIIVDIAPKRYDPQHDHILDGLKSIPVETVTSRNQADELLTPYVPQPGVRQFLLKNLQRKPEGGFQWKINLPVLDNSIEVISDGPDATVPFHQPTLFIRGSKSDYVLDEDMATIARHFPAYQLVTLEAGHWVQAEVPDAFVDAVKSFLKSIDY